MAFDLDKYNELLGRGLCNGKGNPNAQVCIEVAVAIASGEEPTDQPACVLPTARQFAIRLNDARWSSPRARADGMRALGLAQLGTAHLSDKEFARRIVEATIRTIVPMALRAAAKRNPKHAASFDAAASRCACEGTHDAARNAKNVAAAAAAVADAAAAYAAAYAAAAAAYADDAAAAAAYAAAAYAAAAADAAADAAAERGEILKRAASIAVDVLIAMKGELA